MADLLNYEGCNFFRQRLVLSTLSGKSIRIKSIRANNDNPGIRDFEAGFIRLMDKITNGSRIVVSQTGTAVYYQPGLLIGGQLDHDCNTERAIGYYLEPLLCLAPFTKLPIRVILRGVTNNQIDPSVDLIRLSLLPVLKRFLGTDEGLELKISRRGSAPDGGGEVLFSCPCRQKLRPLLYTDPGKIKRIRGMAWATRVSPAVCNRLVDSARAVLNQCLPDIYIYTDHCKGSQAGKSPGFGLTLVAETLNGTMLSAEASSNIKGSESGPTVPEDLGKKAARLLLEEVWKGGCVDSVSQSVTLLLMVLGQQDISKVQIGSLSPYAIQMLRHIRDFLQVQFKVDLDSGQDAADDDDDKPRIGNDKLILTCVGVGYSNISKAIM